MNLNYIKEIYVNASSRNDDLRKAFLTNRIHFGYRIFIVDDCTLAKHGREDMNLDFLAEEYYMGRRLFDAGINVPKFHNFTWLSPEKITGEPNYRIIKGHNGAEIILTPDHDIHYDGNWFILMEKLNGSELTLLKPSVRKSAKELLKKELHNVLDLGICPDADAFYYGNSIFDYDANKLYLIDFESWHDGSKKEIDAFRKRLKGPLCMTGLVSRMNYFSLHPQKN